MGGGAVWDDLSFALRRKRILSHAQLAPRATDEAQPAGSLDDLPVHGRRVHALLYDHPSRAQRMGLTRRLDRRRAGYRQILLLPTHRERPASLYVLLGLVATPFMPAMFRQLGQGPVILVALGGLAYGLGALCYARKTPNPYPGTFGYHEVFHLCVIVGAACHYAGAWIISGQVSPLQATTPSACPRGAHPHRRP